jgi:SAM-dependent methyltransferase
MAEIHNYFGAGVAARYDEATVDMPVGPVVDFLAELAGGGAALELGIGTGRIALPLTQRGVRVQGIDLSPEMVAKLREKPGAESIDVAIGDFATTWVDGSFALAYVVFNTIINLTTQEAQVACFENVAAHLEPGGCFVLEVGVGGGAPLEVFDLSDTHVGIDEYEAATQRLVSHHFTLVDGHWERNSMPFRSVSPGELDLMARLAGMRLRERWGGWEREPFTAESTKHVSVWEKA